MWLRALEAAVLAACICTGSAAHLILDCGPLLSFRIVLQIVRTHSHNRRVLEILSMTLLDRRTISILLTIILFAAAGAFIYRAGHTLLLFLFAILFAYLLDPAVSRLQHWSPLSKGSRGRAILQAYVVLALVLAVLL